MSFVFIYGMFVIEINKTLECKFVKHIATYRYVYAYY